ncbi:endonuclease/exonuclease/phosphatase family protein [Aerophototrophica crusticola]|uniref:endonuclease/exonuclease/phosphatase family protein n=1 Tax=Aerophototrophica crusticola TaxID=1709002 RepID=UPI000AA54A93
MRKFALIAVTSLFLTACASQGPGGPAEVKLATWNIGWLTDRTAEINADNRDPNRAIYQRTAADYARLKGYVGQLGADVVAMQEVDGAETAAKIFDRKRYTVVMSEEGDYQRPGFAISKGIKFTRNPDLAELDVLAGQKRSLRRGVDVTLHLAGGDLRLLAVHLKSGCFTPGRSGEACDQLQQQIPFLDAWIDARQKEGVAFAVLGDFNRRFPAGDPLWAALDDGPTPLVRVTEGKKSTCWGGQYPDFIDHIVLGNDAPKHLVQDSFAVLTYAETDRALQKALSDHCPVSVRLKAGGAVS